MVSSKFPCVSSFCKTIISLLVLQFGFNANAQTIELPIYTIAKRDFSVILKDIDDKSKLTATIQIENSSLDLSKQTKLYLFSFNKKGTNSGARRFINFTTAEKLATIPLDYYSFVVANTEIKIQKIKDELSKPAHKDYKSLAFVPELQEQTLPDNTIIYSLIFTIYSSKESLKDYLKDVNFNDIRPLLTRVSSLNPCPPARPADY